MVWLGFEPTRQHKISNTMIRGVSIFTVHTYNGCACLGLIIGSRLWTLQFRFDSSHAFLALVIYVTALFGQLIVSEMPNYFLLCNKPSSSYIRETSLDKTVLLHKKCCTEVHRPSPKLDCCRLDTHHLVRELIHKFGLKLAPFENTPHAYFVEGHGPIL